MNAPAQCTPSLRAAHMFRSRFIDSFAHVEEWTIETWRRLAAPSGSKAKVPPHLGNRIKRIHQLTESHQALFSTPKELARLLDRLEPYCRLRATLVHGRFETAFASDGSSLFILNNPIDEPGDAFAHRVLLRGDEMNGIIQRLEKLAAELTGQALA